MVNISQKIDLVQKLVKNSPFKKEKYTTIISLSQIPDKILYYNEIIDKNDQVITAAPNVNTTTLKNFVAPFQREIKHWNEQMKIKFIENIILGCRTDIILYTLTKGVNEGCLILDGQHRVNAFLEFIEGKFKVFDCSFKELHDSGLLRATKYHEIFFHIISFDNQNDAIDFYISMNENITHTPEDIKIAKNYLNK